MVVCRFGRATVGGTRICRLNATDLGYRKSTGLAMVWVHPIATCPRNDLQFADVLQKPDLQLPSNAPPTSLARH